MSQQQKRREPARPAKTRRKETSTEPFDGQAYLEQYFEKVLDRIGRISPEARKQLEARFELIEAEFEAKHNPSRCPRCGQTLHLDGKHVEIRPNNKPEPGAVTTCRACGSIQVFNSRLKLRRFSAEEMKTIETDYQQFNPATEGLIRMYQFEAADSRQMSLFIPEHEQRSEEYYAAADVRRIVKFHELDVRIRLSPKPGKR